MMRGETEEKKNIRFTWIEMQDSTCEVDSTAQKDEVSETPVTIGIKSLSNKSNCTNLRLRHSAVHEHYHHVEVLHPSSQKVVDGSVCKYCQARFMTRVATNLKSHLKSKHPKVYEEVMQKDTDKSTLIETKNAGDVTKDEENLKIEEKGEQNSSSISECNKQRRTQPEKNFRFSSGRSIWPSSVHEHYEKVKVPHPVTKKIVPSSVCKHCKKTFAHRISSNLKNHLKCKHREAYNEVKLKDKEKEKSAFIVVGGDVDFEDDDVEEHEDDKEEVTETVDTENVETDQELGETSYTGRPGKSSVHEHFDKMEMCHPNTEKIIKGAMCKYCKTKFKSRVATNLKAHLKNKHREPFSEVQRKDRENVVGGDFKLDGTGDNKKVPGPRKSSFGLDEFERLEDSLESEKFKCRHCSKVMIHNRIRLHLKNKHRDVYRILLAEFKEKGQIWKPRKHSQVGHFKCQKCNYSTNFQRKFDTHQFDEHLETYCQTCGLSFSFNKYDEYYNHLLSLY